MITITYFVCSHIFLFAPFANKIQRLILALHIATTSFIKFLFYFRFTFWFWFFCVNELIYFHITHFTPLLKPSSCFGVSFFFHFMLFSFHQLPAVQSKTIHQVFRFKTYKNTLIHLIKMFRVVICVFVFETGLSFRYIGWVGALIWRMLFINN